MKTILKYVKGTYMVIRGIVIGIYLFFYIIIVFACMSKEEIEKFDW